MPNLSNWNVLIVDDEPDNLGVLELVLSYYQANVRTAISGAQCLDLLAQELPSVLLIDIQMPVMSGYEVLNRIREHGEWRSLPVIAVTAHAMSGDAERVLAAGFDGYISKPINAMTLADELLTIMGTKSLQ